MVTRSGAAYRMRVEEERFDGRRASGPATAPAFEEIGCERGAIYRRIGHGPRRILLQPPVRAGRRWSTSNGPCEIRDSQSPVEAAGEVFPQSAEVRCTIGSQGSIDVTSYYVRGVGLVRERIDFHDPAVAGAYSGAGEISLGREGGWSAVSELRRWKVRAERRADETRIKPGRAPG